MNLRFLFKSFFALLALSLLGFAFSIVGVPGTPIDSFWKLFALSLGLAMVLGYLQPHVRGVRQGDVLMAVQRRYVSNGDLIQNVMDTYFVTALEDGRLGKKIRVRLANNRRGEGIITGYTGTFTPASIRLTESEV